MLQQHQFVSVLTFACAPYCHCSCNSPRPGQARQTDTSCSISFSMLLTVGSNRRLYNGDIPHISGYRRGGAVAWLIDCLLGRRQWWLWRRAQWHSETVQRNKKYKTKAYAGASRVWGKHKLQIPYKHSLAISVCPPLPAFSFMKLSAIKINVLKYFFFEKVFTFVFSNKD